MTKRTDKRDKSDIEAAIEHLKKAAVAKKCWRCGCLHRTLRAIEEVMTRENQPAEIDTAVRAARGCLVDVEYGCLGCEVCYPASAINALGLEENACFADPVTPREGWPPLIGSYRVLRYRAPVTVCTLTDESLSGVIVSKADSEVAIVGTLQTENLGIERIIFNLLANPNIRFLVLCGPDSRQAIGHLPGQSFVSLACSGIDGRGRIVGARGKRPCLRNVPAKAVEHFRRTVEVIDLVGNTSVDEILGKVAACAKRNPGPAEPFGPGRVVHPVDGYLSERMVPDPAGYFVVYVDALRGLISLEHYKNDGLLDLIIEGRSAMKLYTPAIEKGLISRLDHASYLGRELARAEHSLRTGEPYIQDAAPELPAPESTAGCVCTSSRLGK